MVIGIFIAIRNDSLPIFSSDEHNELKPIHVVCKRCYANLLTNDTDRLWEHVRK